MDLAILFVSAFAASTILPMSSETVLGALAVQQQAGRARPLERGRRYHNIDQD